MQATFKQVREFNVAVNGFLNRNPENANTKVGYALKKISETQIRKVVKDYQAEYNDLYYKHVETVQVDNALTDKVTHGLLTAPKGSERPFIYDKDGLKAVMEAERGFAKIAEDLLESWDAKTFDIAPHIVSDVPEDLLLANEKQAFAGFVIPEAASTIA